MASDRTAAEAEALAEAETFRMPFFRTFFEVCSGKADSAEASDGPAAAEPAESEEKKVSELQRGKFRSNSFL